MYVARGDTIIYGIGAFLWCVLVRVSFVRQVFSTVVKYFGTKNVARNAFRGSTIIPQQMTSFDLICPGPILRLTWGLCFNNGLALTAR